MDEICALLTSNLSPLSTVIDVVAALSCEASKADVSDVVTYFDTAEKDQTAVANDMKVMFVGSKLVGGVRDVAVSGIPEIHGVYRETVRWVQAKMRRKLTSSVGFESKAVVKTFMPLEMPLMDLGESSLGRVKLSIGAIEDVDVCFRASEMFEKSCCSFDGLRSGFELVSQAALGRDGMGFMQELYASLRRVREIVAWEAALALLVLDINELNAERANDKKKKNKVALGKGSSVIRQLLKESVQSECGVVKLEMLDKWALDLSLFFDPKDLKFDSFLKNVKEIVESNESRRLPKIPKGTRDFAKEQMAIREKTFSIIQDVFKRHGATSLDTPVFELKETLTEKYGEDSKLIYDLADQIKLNHRKLLDGMLEICGVSSDKFRTICSSIDKLDKQSFDEIRKEMVEDKGLNAEAADKIGAWVEKRGSPSKILSELKQKGSPFLENKGSLLALNDLELLIKALEKSKCIHRVVFDLSLARGLDYYTGVIFEAVFKGTTQVGSIAAGGRYDNLIGMFGTKSVPAVGVSLGMERVITIREKLVSNEINLVSGAALDVIPLPRTGGNEGSCRRST
ncbi:hypothetical protein GIB67_000144 [Kingdonia uniflora]|uniref:Class II Histidinyl-tRNA synthetase (HisRS)-like catalytic core domain-containing protein n=1 Tax=Kingdonia uniflora TaxID=39325 RepID=A0A7J7P9N4_9MAGN|nr:hypothetical protein GIB67_000144 [Kingdonia uniflora]